METQYTLVVINPRTGLSKVIDVTRYTLGEVLKTFRVYFSAGFEVDLVKGNKHG